MSAQEVTVLLRLVADLPDDEQAADAAADELGAELVGVLSAANLGGVASGTIALLDTTSRPIATELRPLDAEPPVADLELEP